MTMTFKQLLAEAAKQKVDLRLASVMDNGDEPAMATFVPANGSKGRAFTVEVDNYKTKVINHSHFDKGDCDEKEAADLYQPAPKAPAIKKAAAKKPAAKKSAAKKTAAAKNK